MSLGEKKIIPVFLPSYEIEIDPGRETYFKRTGSQRPNFSSSS
jgi:hypothetical protein